VESKIGLGIQDDKRLDQSKTEWNEKKLQFNSIEKKRKEMNRIELNYREPTDKKN
jgi:hypothetical protein